MSDATPVSQEIRLPVDVAQVLTATQKLDAMIARVEKLEHATDRHHKKSEAGWEGVEHSVNKAKSAVHEFMGFVGASLAFEGLEKIADKFAEIGKEALGAAAKAQRMNMAIDAAAGGKEQGEATRKWIEDYSKHSIFSEAQNETAFVELKRHGVDQVQSGRFMKASEDLAAIAPPEQAAGVRQAALDALERVHQMGRINARTVGSLGITADSLRAEMPELAGIKNNAKLWKAAGEKNINETTLLRLMMRATGEEGLGQRGSEAAESLYTKMEKLSELPERFYKKLGETEGAKRLASTIGSILEKLDPDSPAGKKIFGGLESTFRLIGDEVSKIDFDEVATTLTDDVFPALKAMAGMIQPTIEAVERVIRGFHEMHDLAFGPTPKNAALDDFDRRQKEATARAARESEHPSFVDKTSNELGGGFRAVGRDFADGFSGGIGLGTPSATEKATAMGEGAVSAVKEATDSHSPSKKAQEVGLDFGDGFAIGLLQSSREIGDAMDSTFAIPEQEGPKILFPRPSSPNININVSVSAPSGDGDAIAEAVAQAVRREVIGALDTTADE